jgi:UDP-glucose 4-epimerase
MVAPPDSDDRSEESRLDALVTGGAGFIGSHLVRALVEGGHRVRVLDDLSTGSPGNLDGVGVEMLVGDLRDPDAVRTAVAGAEVVHHLGALGSVSRSVADPVRSTSVNLMGTLNLLIAARQAGVRRMVFASSSSVYGDTPTLPKHEEMAPVPLSPYGASKLAAESYCRAFAHSYGLETVSLRFFNVFGPRQDPTSEYAAVIPRFASRMLAGEPPLVFGDGRQSRDFTYVDNAVRACLLAAAAGPEAVGEVMNVGCGDTHTLLDLIDAMNAHLGTALQPVFTDPRPGDVRHSLASIEKAERMIKYRPEISVSQGLSKTLDWLTSSATLAATSKEKST